MKHGKISDSFDINRYVSSIQFELNVSLKPLTFTKRLLFLLRNYDINCEVLLKIFQWKLRQKKYCRNIK